MRKLRFPLLAALAFAAFTFTSCDKDEPQTPAYDLRVVDFEGAQLNGGGVLVNAAYEEKGLTFVHNYTVDETYGDYWDGFAVSDNHDKETAGVGNQYSVYGTGGAAGSSKFGVASIFGASEMKFADNAAYEVEYIYVANATYAYIAVTKGDDGGFGAVTKFGDGDWFLLTITGYDAEGTRTAVQEVYLADYRGGKSSVVTDWTKVGLASLGKVNKVDFVLTSSDTGEWMNTPAYFCIDNVAYRVYAE